MKELLGVEQSVYISYYCKYTTLLLLTVFAILEASSWLRFSRKVLFYVVKLHLKFREVWSYGLEVMKNFVHGC